MLISTAAALVIAGSAGLAQQKAPAEAIAFAEQVAGANAFQLQSSQFAQERGQSSEVKSFAAQMMTDHTKIGEDFKAVLQSANVSLPAPEQPDAKLRAEFSKLQKVQGSAFDRAYLSAQLDGHKEAVAILRKYAKSGRTPQLKEFAQRTLPTIEQHLSELTDLSNRAAAAGKAPTGTGSRAIGPPAEQSNRDKNR